jgi:hypothetical protein
MPVRLFLRQACNWRLRSLSVAPVYSAALENVVTYNHTRASLISYLNTKLGEQDWAAVSDVANDLSILDILEARSMAASSKPKSDRRPAQSRDIPVTMERPPARPDLRRGAPRG